MENLANRKQTAEALTGETVNTVELDLRTLLSQGLLINVSVHGTGLFSGALRFEELGIKTASLQGRAKAARRVIDKNLDDRLNSWGTQCRQVLNRYAIRLTSIDSLTASTSWRLLLYSGYQDFRDRWDELQSIGRQIIADAVNDLDNIYASNRDFYTELARDNWDALQARYTYGTAIAVPGYTFGPDDRQAYIEWVVGQALAAIPDREKIESSIFATYQTSILFTEVDLAEEDARQRQAVATRAEANERIQSAYVNQARAEAIRQAEVERARAELEETASPIRELLTQLLEQLAYGTQTLLDGYAKSGQFRGRSLDVARNFPALLRYLGGEFLTNAEIRDLIEQTRGLADSEPDQGQRETVNTQIAANLTQLQGIVEQELTTLKNERVAHTRAAFIKL